MLRFEQAFRSFAHLPSFGRRYAPPCPRIVPGCVEYYEAPNLLWVLQGGVEEGDQLFPLRELAWKWRYGVDQDVRKVGVAVFVVDVGAPFTMTVRLD